MGISEMFSIIGDDNIRFQTLAESSPSMQTVNKGTNGKVSFYTSLQDARSIFDTSSETVGWVVWLPREKLAEIQKMIDEKEGK